ncbi:MAG: hypothetical protein JJU18_13700 [Oceanicaulis sp.]|nr:hypothetical protein [Oceanicaulis sp.]
MGSEPAWVDQAKFNFERVARYHRARSNFYDSWTRWILLVNICFGATFPFSALVEDSAIAFIIAAPFIALVNALALSFDINKRAQDHRILCRQFKDLKSELIEKIERKENLSESYFERRRSEIEQNEYPIFNVLDDLMYIEVCKALGRNPPADMVIPYWKRALKHWKRFEGE